MQKMNETLKKQLEKTFAQTIADLNNQEEAQIFLKDFLTEGELETLSKRLSVAYWLTKKRSYANIQTNLKVSSSTISEINSMKKKEGFKLALKKIEADEWATKWSTKLRSLKI